MMRRRKDNTTKKVAIGAAIAGAVGYLAGVLTAPRSGKDTRQSLKDSASKGTAKAENELKKLQSELDKTIKEAKNQGNKLNAKAKKELDELADKAKDSKEKAQEVLTAVRAGEAEDRDLDRAVKAASRSLTHLKKYLKK